MSSSIVVTTSYPEREGDAQGHFVAAEVRRAVAAGTRVTVLAPGRARASLYGERVVSLGGGDAFGFPGALARLREAPWRGLGAIEFVRRARAWLRREPAAEQLIAHFLLPCGVPIATGAWTPKSQLTVVVHGSDARLFAKLPAGKCWVVSELVRTGASMRCVSSELRELLLRALSEEQRGALERRCTVEACAIDVGTALSKQQARALLGIDEAQKLAVVVARLVADKRVEVALAACERVPSLRALVVGDGPARARLAAQFPRVTFVGQVERQRALAYVAAADALVSASRLEGAPTVVREARALGTPVVCLQAGDLRQWAETDAGIHVVG